MVHISEVSNEFVQDINTVLHDGDAVKVQVINIAPDGKIALSIKRLLPPAPRQPREGRGPAGPVRPASAMGRRVDAPAVAAQAVPPVRAARPCPGGCAPRLAAQGTRPSRQPEL